jgi:hypothetical protein
VRFGNYIFTLKNVLCSLQKADVVVVNLEVVGLAPGIFGQFFENYKSSTNSLSTFSMVQSFVSINFDQKWVGLHFRLIFPQTHLVTLAHSANSSPAERGARCTAEI